MKFFIPLLLLFSLPLSHSVENELQRKGISTAEVIKACHPLDANRELQCKDIFEKATQGDPQAQMIVGMAYGYAATGPNRDLTEVSRSWLEKAANQEYGAAQYLLGMVVAIDTTSNDKLAESRAWYERAAKNGHVDAKASLGGYLANGTGGTRDLAQGIRLLRTAQEEGSSIALGYLHFLYKQELEKTENKSEGANLRVSLQFAEIGNLPEAQNRLANIYSSGGKTIASSSVEACRWSEAAARQNDLSGMHNTAICYFRGRGVGQSQVEAFRWFDKLDKLDKKAAGRLAAVFAALFQDGDSVPRDYIWARKWYREALSRGDTLGISGLAGLYKNGQGGQKNVVLAYALLNMIATEYSSAEKDRNTIANTMSVQELIRGQEISNKLKNSKNLVSELDLFEKLPVKKTTSQTQS